MLSSFVKTHSITGENRCCSCINATIAKKTTSKAVNGRASSKACPSLCSSITPFDAVNKNHISKISTSLRLLEQRGYVKRHRNSPRGPVAYVTFTNDGIFIAKTWARITESNEEDDFKNFDDIEKGFERQDSDSYDQWNQENEP